MSDLRLSIPDRSIYTYPDVMVVETPFVFADNRQARSLASYADAGVACQDTITNPIAIAEILSDSTEKYDRGDKFRMYRTIPSFKEYLLISQTEMQVEKFTKNDENRWVLSEYTSKDAEINFDYFEFKISLDELYDRVDFDNL